MYYRSLLGLAMVAMASAKANPVTTMLIYGADPQPLAASVVGNDATATTYSINCPPGTDGSDCGMGPGLTLIAGPKTTYKMDEGDFHWTVTCSVAATTSAVCTETNIGGNFPGTSVVTLTTDLPFLPVTVTAGSVATRSTTTTTGATTTASSASSASSASGKSTAASTASSSASATGTGAQSTGGMPQVTAHAGSVLGGAVVALAAAVL